jgi:hypothetical protein
MSGGEFKNLASNNPNIQTVNFAKTGVQNFIKTSGTITALTSGGRTMAFNINPGSTLNMGSNVLDNGATSTATFNLSSGGGVKLGHPAGISLSGATGNVQISGTRTFSKGANYEYNGTAAQVTGNGIPDSVRSLTINNSLGITLSNASLTDTVKLGLVSGRIKTDAAHQLILSKTASVNSISNIYGDNNEGTQTSFVSGPLSVECNTTSLYTIPVGKDTSTGVFFAPVKLTPFNNVTKIYTVNYYFGPYADPTVDGTLHHVSSLEYWDVACNLTASPDVDALVGLSWRPTSNICFPVCNTADSTAAWSDLVVAHYFYDGSSTKWRMDGGVPSFTMRTGSTLSYGYVTTTVYTGLFSPFTLGSKSDFNFLPIKLTGFSGFATSGSIQLQWNTTGERNMKDFEIEKSSDGIHFIALQTITAHNSTETNHYNVTDRNPKVGYNYYRLKITDNFQKTAYSGIIKIKYNIIEPVQIYPNPVADYLFINQNGNILPSSVQMIMASGFSIPVTYAANGSGSFQINCSGLQSGWYLLKMHYGNSIVQKPFFKK